MLKSSLPPLTWLRAFEAAARHLSFTLAAKELSLTQSAISQHVRSLEGYLGHELFIRKTRALQLSEAGANYLPVIREAFDLISSGTRAFTGDRREESLVVQCNLAFATFWLTPRLHRLYAKFPWLTLNLTTPIWDPESSAKNSILEIRFSRQSDMPAEAVKLITDHYYPVCRPDYFKGLPNLEGSILFDCSGVMGNWEAWLNSQSLTLPAEQRINLASTYVIALSAATHGVGIAMAHDTLVCDLLEKDALICPFEHKLELPESYFLLRPTKYAETEASRSFSNWLESEFDHTISTRDALE